MWFQSLHLACLSAGLATSRCNFRLYCFQFHQKKNRICHLTRRHISGYFVSLSSHQPSNRITSWNCLSLSLKQFVLLCLPHYVECYSHVHAWQQEEKLRTKMPEGWRTWSSSMKIYSYFLQCICCVGQILGMIHVVREKH